MSDHIQKRAAGQRDTLAASSLHTRSGRRFRSFPIQVLLLALVATVFLPSLGGVAWFIVHERAQASEEAYARVSAVADNIASGIEASLSRSEAMLQQLAERPSVRAVDPRRCDPVFQEHLLLSHESTALVFRDVHGRLICTSSSNSTPLSPQEVLSLDWVAESIASNRFHVSGVSRGVSSGRWVIDLSYPVRDSTGGVAGLLIVGIDLLKLQAPLVRNAPPNMHLAVFDRDFKFAMRSTDPEKWLGKALPEPQLSIAKSRDGKYGRARDIHGVSRLWVNSRMPKLGWTVAVGLPEDQVYASSIRNLWVSAGIAVSILLLTLVLVWRISRPMRGLARSAAALIAGDSAARASVRGSAEIEAIANHFNQLLEDRERAMAALRLSEEKFSKAFHVSPHWIGITRQDTGEFIEVNPGFEKISGYSRAEALGRTSLDLGLWAQPEKREELVAGITAGRRMHDVEVIVRTKDGTERSCLFSHETIDLAGVACMLSIGRDETEITLARQGLQRERDFANRLTETMPAIVLVLDLEGVVRHVNPFFEQLTGWRRDEVHGRVWFDTFLPLRDRDRMRALFLVATDDVPTRGNVNPILTRSGEERQIEWNDHALRDAAGRVTGLLSVGIDVTERQRAGEALRASEARFRAIIDASPVPMALNDDALRVTYLNSAFTRTFGYDREDIPTLADWWPKACPDPAYRQWVAESWQEELVRAARTGTAFKPLEVKIRCKDGTERIAAASAAALQAGLADTNVVVLHDITELKKAEDAISESASRLNEAQRIARVGSWELDLTSGTLVWSDEIYRLFEIDPTKFGATYEAFLEAIHPGDRDAVNAAYTDSLRTRQPYSISHRLRMADGRIKHVEEQCETDFAPEGTPLRSRGTVQDLTERVLAEETIRRSLREKETLLREIHHRVKNNLQIISSLLHFQGRKVKNAEDLAVFEEGRDRLKSMILVHEKLYQSQNLSRIEFGDYVRTLVGVVSSAYRDALKAVEVKIEAATMYLPIEVALPLGMLISELLTNAFKYAFPGGRAGVLGVTVDCEDGKLRLVVSDDGVGLPEGVNPESPESFGMQLVANLAEQLGGEVNYERGAGLRVAVSVPLALLDRDAAGRAA